MRRYEIAEGIAYPTPAPHPRILAMAGYTLMASICLAGAGLALAWLFDAPGEVYRWLLVVALLPVLALAASAAFIAGSLVFGAVREALGLQERRDRIPMRFMDDLD